MHFRSRPHPDTGLRVLSLGSAELADTPVAGFSRFSMRHFIAILLLTLGAATARAEDLTASVPGYAVTYFDLLKLAVPGMTLELGRAVSPSVPEQRHVIPDYYNGEPPNPISIATVAERRLMSEGRERLLLLADAGPQAGMAGNQALLFAYEDREGILVFLDYADVGMGDYFAFVDTLTIGEEDSAVTISSGHHNSQQSYVWTSIVFLRDGRITPIDEIFTFSTQECLIEDVQALAFTLGPGPGPYWSLRAVVTATHRNTEWWTDCGSASTTIEPMAPVIEHVTVGYTWSAAQSAFVPDSNAFDELYKRNEARF